MKAVFDLEACEALVARACDNDDEAWRTLVETLWPVWRVWVGRSHTMGSLARSQDHVDDVVAELIDKLSPHGGAALGLYGAWRELNADKTFEDWIRIVTSYTVRDYVRRALGRSRAREPGLPSQKRLINELYASPAIDEVGGARPAYTAAQMARQLLEFARDRLTPEQYGALTLWLAGADFDEIAAELGTGDAEDGRRLLRAAVATLRRRFVGDP